MKRKTTTSKAMLQSAESETGFFYGYFVIMASFSIMFVMWGVHFAFGVFFKPMLSDFGWTRAMTSGAYSLCTLMNGFLAIVMGGLTDKLGPRLVMTFCGIFLGLGYYMMSRLGTIWQLYLFYGVIIGIGMGGGFIPLVSTVVRWFVDRRGVMTGIVTASTGAGALIGPPVANLLIYKFSWRISFLVLGGIAFAVIVLSAQLLRRDPAQVGQRPYGENRADKNETGLNGEGLSLMEALFTGRFWIFFFTSFCYGFCVFSIMVHLVPHAIELGFSSTRAANMMATIGATGIIGKVLLGRMGDIWGSRQLMMFSFILMAITLFWLMTVKNFWILHLIVGGFGFAYGGCAVSQSPIVAMLFGLRAHGLIFGIFGVGVSIGGAIGPFLMGYVFDVTESYQLAFLVGTVISSAGFILSAVLKSIRTTL
ncbi:MFS transporter [Thermodesulfobacteriota bacterium]